MTDDELTPEQQEVRRLLADARHDEPMPDQVVARLDGVLAGLADEPGREAPVADLATRRRRATTLLVAAAAVVAVGIGVSQVVDTGTHSEDSLSTADRGAADGAAEDADAPTAAERESADAGNQDQGSASAPTEAQEDGRRTALELTTLSRQAYADDVSTLRRKAGTVDELTDSGAFKSDLDAFAAAGATCLAGEWGEGTFVPVRYDGAPAVVVFRRAVGDTQVADLFLCGDAEPRRSTTLPAP